VNVASIVFLAACLGMPSLARSDPHEPHAHLAPHGGALVVLGNEWAHVEFVIDPSSGSLEAYVLDRAAERGVAVTRPRLTVDAEYGESRFRVDLEAVASPLTGETATRTSHFRGQHDLLKGARRFAAALVEIEVKGRSFTNVRFSFPEGNERSPDDRDDTAPSVEDGHGSH